MNVVVSTWSTCQKRPSQPQRVHQELRTSVFPNAMASQVESWNVNKLRSLGNDCDCDYAGKYCQILKLRAHERAFDV